MPQRKTPPSELPPALVGDPHRDIRFGAQQQPIIDQDANFWTDLMDVAGENIRRVPAAAEAIPELIRDILRMKQQQEDIRIESGGR